MISKSNFPGAEKYWHQGRFHDWSENLLHPMVHALHYGTSTFEGIRAYATDKGPAVFRLPDHVDRFFVSASVLKMNPPYCKGEIMEAVRSVLRANGLKHAYVRPLMYYAYGNLGLLPKASPVELLIGAWDWGDYLGDMASKGVSVLIVPRRRIHHTQLDMRAKLGGIYVQSATSALEAKSRGFDEAMFLNLEGRVAEGPGENVFIVKDGVVWTNMITESILEGITRSTVLEIARDLGHPTKIAPIAKEDLFGADEAFFSGTAVEITPISRVSDGSDPDAPDTPHVIGSGRPGPVTGGIEEVFRQAVSGKIPRYAKWLTYVD